MIRKIKIQKPKMPISLNNCDDAINEILDYEKLEEALVENTTIDGIENLSVSLNSCIFKNVVFEYCDFRRIDMTDIIFENCDLSNINFPYSSLYRVEFINCKLTTV